MEKREELYGIIADNIKKERKRLRITRMELAERADACPVFSFWRFLK